MTNTALARTNMVNGQIIPNVPPNQPLYDAMLTIPRHAFLPSHLQGVAYIDQDIVLNSRRHLMSPMLFSQLVHAAAITPSDVILDLGCGTGYSTAILACIGKKIIALESDADLASKANHNLHTLGIKNSIIISGELAEGHPEAAPYDVIFINGAVQNIPATLFNQLADNGRLVAIMYQTNSQHSILSTVFGEIILFQKNKDLISKKHILPTASFPLVDF